MIELLFALGRMVGLGTSAGVRPSLTIAVIGMMHHLYAGTTLNPVLSFLGEPVAIILFVILAMLEMGVDKIRSFDRVAGRLSMPYRVAMGGIAGASTIAYGWGGFVAGAVAGAGVAYFTLHTKQLARPKTVPSDAALVLVSIWEDIAAFGASMLTLAFGAFGFLAVAFTAVMYWRTGYVHRAKYQRMQRRSRTHRTDAETEREEG